MSLKEAYGLEEQMRAMDSTKGKLKLQGSV